MLSSLMTIDSIGFRVNTRIDRQAKGGYGQDGCRSIKMDLVVDTSRWILKNTEV